MIGESGQTKQKQGAEQKQEVDGRHRSQEDVDGSLEFVHYAAISIYLMYYEVYRVFKQQVWDSNPYPVRSSMNPNAQFLFS